MSVGVGMSLGGGISVAGGMSVGGGISLGGVDFGPYLVDGWQGGGGVIQKSHCS